MSRELVRNAYLTVLEREPDEHGWNHYAALLDSGKYTIERIREEMASSYEKAIVRLHKIYQEMFGRPADQGGIGSYAPQIHSGKIDENWLRNEFRNSVEYTQTLVRNAFNKIMGDAKQIEQKDLDRYVPLIRNGVINLENLEKIFTIRKKLVSL